MKKNIFFNFIILLFILVGIFVFKYVLGWTIPTAPPPQGNLPPPINTGALEQTKSGNLKIDGVLRIGLFSSPPAGTEGSLYYDTTQKEFKGFKQSGWASLGASLPTASANQTLRFDGSNWSATSFLTNTGTAIGIGTTTPQSVLDVVGDIIARTSTSTITIKADQSTSTGLNCDMVDGYHASDLISKYVFVTSQTYTGNLGGISGADAKCQQLAQAANLPGTYKAWLSYSQAYCVQSIGYGVYSTFSRSPVWIYRLVDGTIVSYGTPGFYATTLLHPINKTEQNTTVSTKVWTGTYYNGCPAYQSGYDCTLWTSESGSAIGGGGLTTESSSKWTLGFTDYCNKQYRLYCFQQ